LSLFIDNRLEIVGLSDACAGYAPALRTGVCCHEPSALGFFQGGGGLNPAQVSALSARGVAVVSGFEYIFGSSTPQISEAVSLWKRCVNSPMPVVLVLRSNSVSPFVPEDIAITAMALAASRVGLLRSAWAGGARLPWLLRACFCQATSAFGPPAT
jgi:hypothetical protein